MVPAEPAVREAEPAHAEAAAQDFHQADRVEQADAVRAPAERHFHSQPAQDAAAKLLLTSA
jgi:hypothetical protein